MKEMILDRRGQFPRKRILKKKIGFEFQKIFPTFKKYFILDKNV